MSGQTVTEIIVTRLCEGRTLKSIREETGLGASLVERYFNRVVRGAKLPYAKKVYPVYRDEILHNLDRWLAYQRDEAERMKVFHTTLHRFNDWGNYFEVLHPEAPDDSAE